MPTTVKHRFATFVLLSMVPVNGNLGATSEFAGVGVWVSPAPPSLMASPVPRAAVAAD